MGGIAVGALPLAGVRVADLTVVYAGPFLTEILADLGAEVIRVESTQTWQKITRGAFARPSRAFIMKQTAYTGGYPNREPGERPWNRFHQFHAHARNKHSMTVDLRRPEGVRIFKDLVRISDVFVENNPTATMEKLGLTYDVLRKVRPDIIMVRAPAYGTTGHYRDFRAFGMDVEAVVGHSLLRGYPDTAPSALSIVVPSDASSGAHGAFAVLAALNHRRQTGEGQLIDVPLAEAMVPYLADSIMDYTMNGRTRSPIGNRDWYGAIQGCYPCSGDDRWIAITMRSDAEWEGFTRALGSPAWTGDPRFADTLSRLRHHDELDALIAEWASQRDAYEALRLLQEHRVPSGVVETPRESYRNPQLLARSFFEQSTQADTGTYLYPGMLFKLSRSPLGIRKPHVRLGEDNEYVYKGLLGASETEYRRLETEGHIGTEYAPGIP